MRSGLLGVVAGAGERELAEAERLYERCAAQVPAEFLYIFVMQEAASLRDVERARMWWDRMAAKKPGRVNGDYWMAWAALCWAEGNRVEAASAWQKAEAYLGTMPQTGTYSFDREILAGLKRTMATEPVPA